MRCCQSPSRVPCSWPTLKNVCRGINVSRFWLSKLILWRELGHHTSKLPSALHCGRPQARHRPRKREMLHLGPLGMLVEVLRLGSNACRDTANRLTVNGVLFS